MLEILPIPAFQDNYIWLLKHGSHAVVVDPGDAEPVMAVLRTLSLTLDVILLTHHHADHIGGVSALLAHSPAMVYAPECRHYATDPYVFPHIAIKEGSRIALDGINLELLIMEIPGHTLDHIAYYTEGYLFCGDTLFAAGCGRLFEGTPQQMYDSLQRLAKLPENTAVYCAHEYTENNIRFARTLEFSNSALAQRQDDIRQLRQANRATLPSSIGLELSTNPFLRCDSPEIQLAAGIKTKNPLAVFTAIRNLKNQY